MIEAAPVARDRLQSEDYSGIVERAILFSMEAGDVNCPQHIHRRYPKREVEPVLEKLTDRIADLEQKLAELQPGMASG